MAVIIKQTTMLYNVVLLLPVVPVLVTDTPAILNPNLH